MSIFDKVQKIANGKLDEIIEKAKTASKGETPWDRKALVELDYGSEMQYGWKERRGLVGPLVLKNMARKDSIIAAILTTRMNQLGAFSCPQEDRYSPGFKIVPRKPADFSPEDKLKLADPELDEDSYEELKHELEGKRSKLAQKQEKDIAKMMEFILHCGSPAQETDTTHKKIEFAKFIRLIGYDRLVYNYAAIELIPNATLDSIARFYPVSASTIRYSTSKSSIIYDRLVKEEVDRRQKQALADGDPEMHWAPPTKRFKYVQVVRGKVVAAWTEDEMIFEPAHPTADPEDNGYAPGELELLLTVITSHLYAEAHNRNFFTQGIGTKGLLHIKGDNISRAQLEAFKRQWFNQLANSRNAFRPPIVGMADEVKWVELAQSNKDMEFDNWMHYLIRISCAIYQIDPAEINFDISKVNTSTLNEANSEQRIKSSKDKGLQPLLDYIANIMNRHILAHWDAKLSAKYEFKFVGLEAETRVQEVERLAKETEVWKTLNEARIEMGFPPIEDGDVVLNVAFTQYKQMKMTNEQAELGLDGEGGQDDPNKEDQGFGNELDDLSQEMDGIVGDATKQADQERKDKETASKEKEKKSAEASKKTESTKKSSQEKTPLIIEYYDDKKKEDK